MARALFIFVVCELLLGSACVTGPDAGPMSQPPHITTQYSTGTGPDPRSVIAAQRNARAEEDGGMDDGGTEDAARDAAATQVER